MTLAIPTRARLHVVPGGTRRGLWCPEHALPHAEETTVYGLSDEGCLLTLRSVRTCA